MLLYLPSLTATSYPPQSSVHPPWQRRQLLQSPSVAIIAQRKKWLTHSFLPSAAASWTSAETSRKVITHRAISFARIDNVQSTDIQAHWQLSDPRFSRGHRGGIYNRRKVRDRSGPRLRIYQRWAQVQPLRARTFCPLNLNTPPFLSYTHRIDSRSSVSTL